MHLEPVSDLIWDPVIGLCVDDQVDGGENGDEAWDDGEAAREYDESSAGETHAPSIFWSVLHSEFIESLQNLYKCHLFILQASERDCCL